MAEVPEANAMALATADLEGRPCVRYLLFKSFDERGLSFHTNYGSRKGRQLAALPQACLVFFWAPLERQVRIDGAVEKVSAAESDAYFATRPVGARLSARTSAQSSVVPDRNALEHEMRNQQRQYGDNPPRPPHWGGYRVIPSRMEFWQGRENRLHDRLLYLRDGGSWKIERLAP